MNIHMCLKEIDKQLAIFSAKERIDHSFRVDIANYEDGDLVELVFTQDTDNNKGGIVLFDATWKTGDHNDRITKWDLFKAFKEIGNAMIREHNQYVF